MGGWVVQRSGADPRWIGASNGAVGTNGNQRSIAPVALADIGATSEAAAAGEQGAPGLDQGVEE